MTTQELKQYIDKVLGNNLRCLLPSYWWKRLFASLADRVDEVEQSTSKLIESKVEEVKMPIVESVDELEKLELAKGRVAAVEKTGESATVKISDCYLSSNFEEDWDKYTIVKGIEEKDVIIDKDVSASVMFSASKETINKDALQVTAGSGIFNYVKWADEKSYFTSLEEVNKALSSGKYRAIFSFNYPDDCFIDDYFTFYSEKPQPSLYIKGDSWERLAKESDLERMEGGSEDDNSGVELRDLYIYQNYDGTFTQLTEEQKAWNLETLELVKQGKAIVRTTLHGTTFILELFNEDNEYQFGYTQFSPSGGMAISVYVAEDGLSGIKIEESHFDSELSTTSINAVQNKVVTAALNDKASIAYVDEKVANAGGNITVDSELSDTSENPVQNKVLAEALDNKVSKDGGTINGDLSVTGKITAERLNGVLEPLNSTDANTMASGYAWVNKGAGGTNIPYFAGTMLSLDAKTKNTLQIFGNYDSATYYIRNKNRDTNSWHNWQRIITESSDSISPSSGTLTIDGSVKANDYLDAYGISLYETFATKTELGDINAVLDAINGEVI
jgi:hypothetical protein